MQQRSFDRKKKYMLYCAGYCGEKIAYACLGKNIEICCFIDNYANKKEYLNVPLYRYEDAKRLFPGAKIIVCNLAREKEREIFESLNKDGMEKDRDYYSGVELLEERFLSENDIKEGFESYIKNNECIVTGDSANVRLFCEYGMASGWKTLTPCFSKQDINAALTKYPLATWILLYDNFKYDGSTGMEDDRKQRLSFFREKGVEKVLDYGIAVLNNPFYYAVGKGTEHCGNGVDSELCLKFRVTIDSLIISITEGFSGNVLLNSMINGHPQIADIGYSIWGNNVFFITESLLYSTDIAEDWIRLLNSVPEYQNDFKSYSEEYKRLAHKYFEKGKRYSEKDIFIGLFLIRYEYTHKREATGHIKLYIDPHSGRRFHIEGICALCSRCGIEVCFIKSIRRPISQVGSALDYFLHMYGNESDEVRNFRIVNFAYEREPNWMKNYTTIRFRFEDLKVYPDRMTHKLCEELDIDWHESILSTTNDNKEMVYEVKGRTGVRGYDVKPAWNTYEKYFDGFDRFRLALLYRLKSKAYGYSSVVLENIPGEIFSISDLFSKPWRFEDYICFADEEERTKFHDRLQRECVGLMNKMDAQDLYSDLFAFGSYVKIETGADLQ